MKIEIYTDGSATTNDKPGGWAWVMTVDGVKRSEGSGYMPNASNNDAELEAAIQGLATVKKEYIDILFTPGKEPPPGQYPKNAIVILVSDSQLVLGWTNGTYAFRQVDKMEKFKRLQLLVNEFNVQTRWVEGHTGDEHNERCDKLANAARLQADRPVESQSNSMIGHKKNGTLCVWYKNCLKVIDLDANIVENHDKALHGSRDSRLEIQSK